MASPACVMNGESEPRCCREPGGFLDEDARRVVGATSKAESGPARVITTLVLCPEREAGSGEKLQHRDGWDAVQHDG